VLRYPRTSIVLLALMDVCTAPTNSSERLTPSSGETRGTSRPSGPNRNTGTDISLPPRVANVLVIDGSRELARTALDLRAFDRFNDCFHRGADVARGDPPFPPGSDATGG